MQELERHRRWGEWFKTLPPSKWKSRMPYLPGSGYTDCCLNFQCCLDKPV